MNRKIVLITGASSGIGEACARLFASHGGYDLVLVARRQERLAGLQSSLLSRHPNLSAQIFVANVQSSTEVTRVAQQHQKVDILINNAGLAAGLDTVEHVKDEDIDAMMDTNVKGLLYMTREVLKGMKERQAGHIINIGSVAGKYAYPNGAAYCASKSAARAITEALRMELVDTPIRVSEVTPGLVETEFSKVRFGGDGEKAKQVYQGIAALQAQDIADIVYFIASRPSHVQIANVEVYPTNQATPRDIYRRPTGA